MLANIQSHNEAVQLLQYKCLAWSSNIEIDGTNMVQVVVVMDRLTVRLDVPNGT